MTSRFFIALLFCSLFAVSAARAEGRLVHIIHFDDYEIGSEEDWLLVKGFQFRRDMQRRDHIDLEVSGPGTQNRSQASCTGYDGERSCQYIRVFLRRDRLGASTSFRKARPTSRVFAHEAMIVLFFMGDERLPSGSILIPNSPHFIGLFLCHNDDRINHPLPGQVLPCGRALRMPR